MEEVFYQCPYCFARVSLLVDTSVAEQQYIEDCERCCNPVEFFIKTRHGQVENLEARPTGQ